MYHADICRATADILTGEGYAASTGYVSLDRVADLLLKASFAARVDMTGGGVATLYAGDLDTTDADGFYPGAVACGPGTFDHVEFGESVIHVSEIWVGRDGHDDRGRYVEVKEATREGRARALASIISAEIRAIREG